MLSSTNTIFIFLLILALISFYIFAFRIKWRDLLTSVLNPLIRIIPPLITPNHVSIMGFLLVFATALLIYLAKYNYLFWLWAAFFMFLYGIVDNLDGILARARGQVTKSGAFLDYTLDKLSYQFLLFSLIPGEHVRAELVVISMLCSLFYSFVNMEAQALTGSTAPLAERPRWMILAIILCIIAFLIKILSAETLNFGGIRIRTLDVFFVIMPVYQIAMIFGGSFSLWKKLKKLDQEEKQI